ncbi:transcription factor VOZ1-like isoform X1 [Punica granatum]|uniref:Transcription factor VOZ1-like isoform X1 n=2 Tax=Punica granatum TaxID=22663 RepID=A0A6P8DJA4_PUNGR|nr:transcription factor VOZ1-like isoform X1 [Punica granatum]XP_031391628.1 transcription factor VOZ1-like isoform X1 [Punica granatum]
MDSSNIERNGVSESPLQPQQMTEKARKLTEDIQEIMTGFQSACKEARTSDISSMVEQVVRLLKDLKDEFSATSPASPIPVDSFGSLSDDMRRLVQQLCDEQDDATSILATLKPDPDIQSQQLPSFPTHQGNNFESFEQHNDACLKFYECDGSGFNGQNEAFTNSDLASLDFRQLDLDQLEFDESNNISLFGHDMVPNITPQINPPPKAFLGSKCALWDCQRPAQGSDWGWDYCSSMHADLALKESEHGMNPILRPGGIGLKDDRLFATLVAKMQGKYVGIPECQGAAIEKSPWNASKLFDLSLLEGETIREWLFFDKPRRAFESGNRKQRSLSDYNGRGWHESRKQVMKELGGQKRSYYMDPQPPGQIEWHLYEYETHNSDVCALYKLELKLVSEKKNPKGLKSLGEEGGVANRKAAKDPLVDLQKQMGRLTAEASTECKRPAKGRAKGEKLTDSG